jgi:hypothetical protein
MTPAQLLQHYISVHDHLANVYRMISKDILQYLPANLVVLDALVLLVKVVLLLLLILNEIRLQHL